MSAASIRPTSTELKAFADRLSTVRAAAELYGITEWVDREEQGR